MYGPGSRGCPATRVVYYYCRTFEKLCAGGGRGRRRRRRRRKVYSELMQ